MLCSRCKELLTPYAAYDPAKKQSICVGCICDACGHTEIKIGEKFYGEPLVPTLRNILKILSRLLIR